MTNAQYEMIQQGLNGVVYAQVSGDVVAEVRAESRLFDYCLNAGMSFDEPNHIDWAALRLGDWLSA
jgi:hypothetical protein